MRKNNGKLILGIIIALVICVLTGIFAPGMAAGVSMDEEFGSGHELVYTVDSTDEAVIKANADILARRLESAGATSVTKTIEGNKVTLRAVGLSDIDSIKSLMTRTGSISFRNSANELLMGDEALDPEEKLGYVIDANNNSFLVINVKDGDAFYAKTAALALASNKLMVVWCDYQEGQDYATEAAKATPAFIGAANVTSGFRDSCYVSTHMNRDNASVIVNLINNGPLTDAVTEVSCTEFAGVHAPAAAWAGILAGAGILAVLAIIRYGVAGIIAAILLAGYVVSYFRTTALAGSVFNSELLLTFGMSLGLGCFLADRILNGARKEMLKGRNLTASYQTAFSNCYITTWETAIAEIIVGTVGYVLAGDAARGITAGAITGGVCNLVFAAFLLKIVLMAFVESGHLNRNSFGIKDSDVPDVQKGESYQIKEKTYDYAAIIGNRVFTYIILALGAGGLIMILSKGGKSGLYLSGAIILNVVLTCIYSLIRHKNVSAGLLSAAVLAGGFVSLLVAVVLGNSNAVSISCLAVILPLAIVALGDLKEAYRPVSREKMNQEKLARVVNSALNRDNNAITIMAIAAVVTTVFGSYFSGIGACIYVIICICCGGLLTAALWMTDTLASSGKHPTRKKKNNRKEIRENTIFGLNEVK